MRKHPTTVLLEELESRDLLSAGGAVPAVTVLPAPAVTHGRGEFGRSARPVQVNPLQPGWFQPDQIRHAYGFDQITFNNNGTVVAGDGSGQTIAIVDVYDDPHILDDANVFSGQFGLPLLNQDTFVKLNEYGNPGQFPTTIDPAWAGEISLDVEWAHAIAPGAKIVLVEANSQSFSDVTNALNAARNHSGVTVVSMSWGYNERDSFMRTQVPSYDSYLTTPPGGHSPITFVAATLDNGARFGVYWPAVSQNVLAVGGTTLTLNADNTWAGETGWRYSGGGISRYEPQPSYQNGVVTQSNTWRTNPDVAYAASPSPGFAIYDTVPYRNQIGWFSAYGTSAGTPQWAALVAIADQGLALQGPTSMDGPAQVLPGLYSLARSGSYSTNFHDITQGNNGYPAGTGYDLITGLGTPKANNLVPALINYAVQHPLASSTDSGTPTAVLPAVVPPAAVPHGLARFSSPSGEQALALLSSSSGAGLGSGLASEGARQNSPADRFWLAYANLPGNDSSWQRDAMTVAGLPSRLLFHRQDE